MASEKMHRESSWKGTDPREFQEEAARRSVAESDASRQFLQLCLVNDIRVSHGLLYGGGSGTLRFRHPGKPGVILVYLAI